MRRDVDALTSREFDLLVVGGGINGTGVARDAALRGLSVALVEKNDFGFGTTGRSTRLIHGGLRYLENFDFALVRESLRERERLLKNAPHLVRPLEFFLPVYAGEPPPRWKLRLGMWLYDLLSFDKSLPNHRYLSREEALAAEPALKPEGLKGAAVYYDAQVPLTERLSMENALDAAHEGAIIANYAEVEEFLLKDGRVAGARVRDRLTGREFAVRAKMTLNATGPWLTVLDLKSGEKRLRMTKGIHIVVPQCVNHAIVLFSPKDNRLFFAVPWLGRTLIGTTDTEYRGELDTVHADEADVRYMIESAREHLPGALRSASEDADGRSPLSALPDVHYAYAGVRSLVNVEGVSEGVITRKHLLLDHEKVEGIPGLVTIVGGKITPYREVSEETVNLALRKLGRKAPPATRDRPLPGAVGGEPLERVRERARAACAAANLPLATADHLTDAYGVRFSQIVARAERDPALAEPLCEHGPAILAEVDHAVAEEMALLPADVLLRRTTTGWLPCEGLDALPRVIERMAKLLGWGEDERRRAEADYHHQIALRHRFDPAASTPRP